MGLRKAVGGAGGRACGIQKYQVIYERTYVECLNLISIREAIACQDGCFLPFLHSCSRFLEMNVKKCKEKCFRKLKLVIALEMVVNVQTFQSNKSSIVYSVLYPCQRAWDGMQYQSVSKLWHWLKAVGHMGNWRSS